MSNQPTLMQRIWNSPWFMLALTAFCVWIAATIGHGFWYWVWIINCNYALYSFIARGNKRWRRA